MKKIIRKLYEDFADNLLDSESYHEMLSEYTQEQKKLTTRLSMIDVVSLCTSVAEVMANPADPWAWAGLVGDAVDLVPFVTGVGEVTRAAEITVKALGDADDVVKATRRLYNSSGISSAVRKMTGSYEIKYASGQTYI